MSLGAIVVCGGESRRMGRSKAWLAFGPELMLQRLVRIVAEVADPIIVVAAREQQLPDLPSQVRIVRDSQDARGPLQALETGLLAMSDEVTHVYATATDSPFLISAWINHLMTLIGENDAVIPIIDDMPHPLASIYRRSAVLPAIRILLDQGNLRLRSLLPLLRFREVRGDELRVVDPELETLQNLNTFEDYQVALVRAGFR